MADFDLSDPTHLAHVLRATLPDFDEETEASVAPHLDALVDSDADHFGHVGRAERVRDDAHAPVESSAEQLPPPPAEHAQQAPLPLDLGGEGLLLQEQAADGLEIALPVPLQARRGWTDMDRRRAKGRHEIYRLAAGHERNLPIKSAFTGSCQSVRVTLPLQRAGDDAFIGTWIGTVEAEDHLAFSVEEVLDLYARAFGTRPVVARVDLITGARFRGRRFSPVSVFLAYATTAPDADPIFYMLEGGSASGKPKAMYYARAMGDECKAQADFRFTPFACESNWYTGGLEMSPDKREPACVYLDITQTRDGRHGYLKLSVGYARDREMRRVLHPFELQVEAAMRVMAIADEAGCQLDTGRGGVLQHSLGPVANAMLSWDTRPQGTTTPQERAQFCGCPEN